jgi:hypothetical protein
MGNSTIYRYSKRLPENNDFYQSKGVEMRSLEILSGLLLGASFVVAIESPMTGIFLLVMSFVAIYEVPQ